jgi:anti-sigma28 factor (negative regulator of flagellin synthesis)
VRIGEAYSYFPQSNIRSAIPAPAKELTRQGSESLENDSVTGIAAAAAGNREKRIEELRQEFQDGSYKVDPAEVASKLIDSHLDS